MEEFFRHVVLNNRILKTDNKLITRCEIPFDFIPGPRGHFFRNLLKELSDTMGTYSTSETEPYFSCISHTNQLECTSSAPVNTHFFDFSQHNLRSSSLRGFFQTIQKKISGGFGEVQIVNLWPQQGEIIQIVVHRNKICKWDLIFEMIRHVDIKKRTKFRC
eukprot:TRINITY_DN5138_c0_g1_i1.p1 TRINITY_DN5138_c0_g1~~TRINITY_DN5138_c0_g1_i1.p1  ORF type:complete len:161 (-),score=4.02 TRINITY_DN5138_c0_g1_i1:150-632(-)